MLSPTHVNLGPADGDHVEDIFVFYFGNVRKFHNISFRNVKIGRRHLS